MMKKLMFAALAGASVFAVAPAQAVVITAGQSGVTPTAGVPAGQGNAVTTGSFTGTALTFSATIRYAVYLNTANTYDFYFQVQRNGAGSSGDEMIDMLTVSDYTGYTTDVYASGPDPDGAGFFTAANNPNAAGQAISTTTAGRRPAGNVVTFDFGTNGLVGTETSATYIVRTNATNYNFLGSFGVIDGSTLQGLTFQPAAGVPEPATWGMMLLGFGLIGAASRRSRKVTTVLA